MEEDFTKELTKREKFLMSSVFGYTYPVMYKRNNDDYPSVFHIYEAFCALQKEMSKNEVFLNGLKLFTKREEE